MYNYVHYTYFIKQNTLSALPLLAYIPKYLSQNLVSMTYMYIFLAYSINKNKSLSLLLSHYEQIQLQVWTAIATVDYVDVISGVSQGLFWVQ